MNSTRTKKRCCNDCQNRQTDNTPPRCYTKKRRLQNEPCNNQPSTTAVTVSRSSSEGSVIYVGSFRPFCPIIDLTNSSTSLKIKYSNPSNPNQLLQYNQSILNVKKNAPSAPPKNKKTPFQKRINLLRSGNLLGVRGRRFNCMDSSPVVGNFDDGTGEIFDEILDWQESLADLNEVKLDPFSLNQKLSNESVAKLMQVYDVHPGDTFN